MLKIRVKQSMAWIDPHILVSIRPLNIIIGHLVLGVATKFYFNLSSRKKTPVITGSSLLASQTANQF